jgi:transposase
VAITLALLDAIEQPNLRIGGLERQIREALELHPDGRIFTSLPKAGMVRPATLLAEIGDVRGRFRTDDALAALAGVAPSTRRSGKLHAVSFRYACDKKLGLLRPPARRGSASAGCRDSEGPCRTGPSTADAP